MKAIKKKLTGWLAALIFRLGRALILGLPDSALALLVRGVRWLAYLITGDVLLRVALTDVMEIFQDGPPGTAVVRKMVRAAELRLSRDVVRGLMGM